MTSAREWFRSDTAKILRVPRTIDDKYSRGVVALRTGSAQYPGAAVLSTEGAWRAGAGFVRYTGNAAEAVLQRRPETVAGTPDARAQIDAWVVGSGMTSEMVNTERIELTSILESGVPTVVDAAALELLTDRPVRFSQRPLLLAPHAGEFARLRAALRLPESADLPSVLSETAQLLGQTILLKGSRTLIAPPEGEAIVVTQTTPWLATAGTGDVLAGVLGALLAAQHSAIVSGELSVAEVAAAGAWLHGYAAQRAAGVSAPLHGHPIVALDVAEALPLAFGDVISS